jgi:hypothetical protein
MAYHFYGFSFMRIKCSASSDDFFYDALRAGVEEAQTAERGAVMSAFFQLFISFPRRHHLLVLFSSSPASQAAKQ